MSDPAERNGGSPRFRRGLWCGGVVFAGVLAVGAAVPLAPVAETTVEVETPASWAASDVAVATARATQAGNDAAGNVPISVEPLGHRTFRVAAQGTDPASSRRASSEAAQRIVTDAGRIFAVPAPARLTPAETEVVSFVGSGIGLLTQAPESRPRPARPDDEKVRLEIERKRVLVQLARLEEQDSAAPPSDDPFADPRVGDPRVLRRRLIEIDRLLSASKLVDPPAVDRSFQVKLGRLLERVRLEATAATSSPLVRARVLGDTAVVPERRPWWRLLGLASLAGVVAGVLPLLARRRAQPTPVVLSGIAPASSPPPRSEQKPASTPVYTAQDLSLPVPNTAVPAPTPAAPTTTRSSSFPPADSLVMAYPVKMPSDSGAAARLNGDLCAKLRELATAECLVCVVTSAASDEGAKRQLTLDLARGLADAPDARILAVDANLAEPSLHTLLGLHVPADVDFSRQLAARAEGVSDGHWYVFKGSPSLHVLCSDMQAPDLVLSTHFEQAIHQLRRYYDIIVLLGPSLNQTVHCQALSDVTEAVILAERAGTPSTTVALGAFSGKAFSTTVRVP